MVILTKFEIIANGILKDPKVMIFCLQEIFLNLSYFIKLLGFQNI